MKYLLDTCLLAELVKSAPEPAVLPFGQQAAHVWALMVIQAAAQGKPMAAFDSIIAATALMHGLSLVTRNIRDFNQAGVNVINPWPEA